MQMTLTMGDTPNAGQDKSVADILKDRDSKDFADLRDRAAYVYATGTFPSHLRRGFTGMLRFITQYARNPVSFDGRSGHMRVTPEIVQELGLDRHPMVRKVREYVAKGYQIQIGRDLTARRPYSKVFMYQETGDGRMDQITVQHDGSIKDNWS